MYVLFLSFKNKKQLLFKTKTKQKTKQHGTYNHRIIEPIPTIVKYRAISINKIFDWELEFMTIKHHYALKKELTSDITLSPLKIHMQLSFNFDNDEDNNSNNNANGNGSCNNDAPGNGNNNNNNNNNSNSNNNDTNHASNGEDGKDECDIRLWLVIDHENDRLNKHASFDFGVQYLRRRPNTLYGQLGNGSHLSHSRPLVSSHSSNIHSSHSILGNHSNHNNHSSSFSHHHNGHHHSSSHHSHSGHHSGSNNPLLSHDRHLMDGIHSRNKHSSSSSHHHHLRNNHSSSNSYNHHSMHHRSSFQSAHSSTNTNNNNNKGNNSNNNNGNGADSMWSELNAKQSHCASGSMWGFQIGKSLNDLKKYCLPKEDKMLFRFDVEFITKCESQVKFKFTFIFLLCFVLDMIYICIV